ncbi:MAG: seryl-tRNA synthetase [Henriciella sp.]
MNVSLKILFLLAVIAQFFVPVLPQMGLGETIGDRAIADGIPPELPLGVFFSIWGVIFLGLFVLALRNLTSPEPALEQLSLPLMLAVVGNLLWMLSAQTLGLVWLDFVLLLPILAATWWAAYRQDRVARYDGTFMRILIGLTVGLFAGWLTVAVSISVPDLGRWILSRGPTDAIWQSLWMTLVPAIVLATVFANRVSRNLWYFGAVGWGLFGIVMNNWARTGTHWLAIITAVIAAYVLFRRLRFGAKGSYPDKLST